MATKFFIKGDFPTAPPTLAFFEDEGFVRDATRINALPDQLFEDIDQRINKTPFIGPRGIRSIIKSLIADPETRTSVTNAYVNLQNLRRSSGRPPEEFAVFVDSGVRQQFASALSADEVARLAHRMSRIATPPAPVLRQEKAEGLAFATGWILREFRVITDLRPVFDDGRSEVEGLMPLITATVVVDDPDGLATRQTLCLSEDALDDLLKTAESAKRKLAALRSLIAKQQISTPESPKGDDA